MHTKSIRLTPEEVLEILKKHFNVNDASLTSLSGCNGMSWEGLWLMVYDEISPLEKP